MNIIGNRIKELRKSKGLTQIDMASKLDISTSAYGFYEQGRNTPPLSKLKAMANIFNVNIEYLSGESDMPHQADDYYRRIKVYGEVPAGIPIEAIEDIQDFEDISFKEFDRNKEYIGLKVKGDSMYPKYLHGDTVIVEVTPCCDSGDDVVCYVNGYNATLKKIIFNSNGTITLQPLNPVYPPRTYGDNDDPISILGVVKEIRRKL